MTKSFYTFAAIILLTSCATVIDGRYQQIGFDSNEKDVEIVINNETVCKTPCMAKVRRNNQPLMVTARKEGFEDRTIFLNKVTNQTSVFNFFSIWTSTFGFTTDLTSKTIWEYKPNAFYVSMLKEPTTPQEKKLYIQQNKIRDFVLANYEHLQNDAFGGESKGEYLQTLVEMSGLSVSQIMVALENAYAAPDATEVIVGLYLKSVR